MTVGTTVARFATSRIPCTKRLTRTSWLKLRGIVGSADRGVRLVSDGAVFPSNTVYYPDRLPIGASRKSWFRDACAAVSACDLVFLDPDNGLVPAAGHESSQYATMKGIRELTSRGQSVVTIQFFGRMGSHRDQLQRRLSELRAIAPIGAEPFALRWKSYRSLGFLIVPATVGQEQILKGRAGRMLGPESPWRPLFDGQLHGSAEPLL